MNVYPNNELEYAIIESSEIIREGSKLSNMVFQFLELQTLFTSNSVMITFSWEQLATVAANSFIIGNTTAIEGRLRLFGADNRPVFDSTFQIESAIDLVELPRDMVILRAELELSSNVDIYLGYVYLGKKMTLPRFAALPTINLQILGQGNRSYGGQVYGLYRRTLTTASVNFIRLTNIERLNITAYINSMLYTQPHVIDLWPEAREEFPLMYCTLNSGMEMQKRNEDGFFWDASLSWLEAR
jgi:hypothetical protein